VRDGAFMVDGSGNVVFGRSRVCVVELPMPKPDPPELQDARATATTTSTAWPMRLGQPEQTGMEAMSPG